MQVIKALCFFYYLLILPCIWLGKKIWWGCFADTANQKQKAEQAVLRAARHMDPGEMEKIGMVSLPAELAKYQAKYERKLAMQQAAHERAEEEATHAAERLSRPPGKNSESSMEFLSESLWDPEHSPSGWVEDVSALMRAEPTAPEVQADSMEEQDFMSLPDAESVEMLSSKHHKHRDSKSDKRRKSSGSKRES